MTVITKRYLIVFLALAAFAAGAISGGVIMNAAMAPLKARVAHLQVIADQFAPSQDDIEQLEGAVGDLEARLQGEQYSSKLQDLQARIAKLEKILPYPSVSALQLKDYVGQTVGVYGTVIKVKNKDGNLFITAEGGTQIVVWGYTGETPAVGDGVYAVGQVKLYNMKPEVVADTTSIQFAR